jgi:hypothetical protein
MLPKLILLAAFVLNGLFSAAQGVWDVYMAQYEDGHAGSTVINMALREHAPMKQFPFLLKAGVKLQHCSDYGLPDKEEMEALYEISGKIRSLIDSTTSTEAGTFSYRCKRTDYYYLKDTAGIRQTLSKAFTTLFPKYEYYIEIKADPNWDAYLTFLYPSPETMDYMADEKVVMSLSQAGDKPDKPRLVDHWLYFNTDAGREEFIKYAEQTGFKVEGREKKQTALPFGLHLSRTDKVDIDSIHVITTMLRKKARELHGNYDGWETFVVKP